MRGFFPRLAFFAALFVFLCSAACRADEIDDYVRAQMREQHIPGLSIAVVRSGRVIRAQGYGLENLEQGTPASADTVYRLASLTKQFTAEAILMLVQDGKLKLDDRINHFLDAAPPLWADITVRELLTHTSGIKDYLNDMSIETCHGTTEMEIMGGVGAMPLKFAPGTQEAYSNTNYLVLGAIIAKITGQSYDRFLQQRVFGPLGMMHTGRSDPDAIVPHRAAGYVLAGGKIQNAEQQPPTIIGNADAGLTSTVTDLARWDAALMEDKLLPSDLQAAAFEPAKLADGSTVGYGFGWVVGMNSSFVSHTGRLLGFSSYIVRFPTEKLTVIVLTNRSDAAPSTIGRHIAAMIEPKLAAHAGDANAGSDPAVTAIFQSVLEGIQNNTLRDDLFAPEMWARGDKDEIVAALRRMFASAGPLHGVTFVSVNRQGDKRQYFYEANFGDMSVLIDATLNQAAKITSMGVEFE